MVNVSKNVELLGHRQLDEKQEPSLFKLVRSPAHFTLSKKGRKRNNASKTRMEAIQRVDG